MTAAVLHDENAVFAANRATGTIALRVAAGRRQSRRTRVYEDGSLRVRFPNTHANAPLEAIIVNTAGGMAGGDKFSVETALNENAALTVGTAAAEKIYRSIGSDTQISVRLSVGAGARLVWLPQETILFDRARLSRSIDVELAADAALVLCEAVVFGRSAMGETVSHGALIDRWRLRRAGKLVFAETTRLDGEVANKLARPVCAKNAAALATLLIVPGDDGLAGKVRALTHASEVAVSAWNGLALVRFCARDGTALRHDIINVLAALNCAALPRLWLS